MSDKFLPTFASFSISSCILLCAGLFSSCTIKLHRHVELSLNLVDLPSVMGFLDRGVVGRSLCFSYLF